MFIHEMTINECRTALEKAKVGRLACARDDQPYVVPINFAFDGNHLYGFTTLGQKVEWMRSNPLVCLELDEVISNDQWVSIVIFGRYEELPDTPDYQYARTHAHELLSRHAMWWEPAYISQQHRDQPHSLTPIFYRVHIQKMTGHRATPENEQEAQFISTASEVKRGWLSKLLHPKASLKPAERRADDWLLDGSSVSRASSLRPSRLARLCSLVHRRSRLRLGTRCYFRVCTIAGASEHSWFKMRSN
jgi:uncharacterized protein